MTQNGGYKTRPRDRWQTWRPTGRPSQTPMPLFASTFLLQSPKKKTQTLFRVGQKKKPFARLSLFFFPVLLWNSTLYSQSFLILFNRLRWSLLLLLLKKKIPSLLLDHRPHYFSPPNALVKYISKIPGRRGFDAQVHDLTIYPIRRHGESKELERRWQTTQRKERERQTTRPQSNLKRSSSIVLLVVCYRRLHYNVSSIQQVECGSLRISFDSPMSSDRFGLCWWDRSQLCVPDNFLPLYIAFIHYYYYY